MTDQTNAPIDQESLEARLRWIQLEELTGDQDVACIDGRFDDCVVGAPGGDAGELVLMLSAIEEMFGETFEVDDIDAIIGRLMDAHGRFYLHTDRAALDQLEETVRGDDELSEALDEAGSIDALVRQPPAAVRDEMSSLLVEPEHTGCGHLKTMLAHHDEFGVRRGLVEATMRAFLNHLWRGRDEADFVILEGEHSEEAIIAFDTDEALGETTRVPGVCHDEAGPSLFVNHLPVHRFMRERTLAVLAETVEIDESKRDALLDRAEELGGHFAQVTVSHLAPDLPVYEVAFGGEEVEGLRE